MLVCYWVLSQSYRYGKWGSERLNNLGHWKNKGIRTQVIWLKIQSSFISGALLLGTWGLGCFWLQGREKPSYRGLNNKAHIILPSKTSRERGQLQRCAKALYGPRDFPSFHVAILSPSVMSLWSPWLWGGCRSFGCQSGTTTPTIQEEVFPCAPLFFFITKGHLS